LASGRRPPIAGFFLDETIAARHCTKGAHSLWETLLGDGRRVRTGEAVTLVSFLRPVKLLPLLLLVPTVVLAQTVGRVRGVVYDSVSGVVSSAHVSIKGSANSTTTDSAGVFRLANIPAGNAVLEVRRLGYRPVSTAIMIPAGSEIELEVELAAVPGQLATVEVRGRAEAYDSRLAGFNTRKSKHVGYIVTREKIDRMSSHRFVDALRGMPGVSMRTLRGGVVTVSLRGARCAPMFYMDGFPAISGAMDLDMIDLSGVEGIEVYSGLSSIPAEFMTVAGGESCGVIAVWSRPFRPRARNQPSVSQAELERLVAQHTVFTADQVTEPAALVSGETRLAVYPDSLWAARIPGRVVAEFIVGEDGRVESGTIAIASATHPYFAAAVRSALEGVVFNPALLNGKPVRQLVQLPFQFVPQPASKDSSAVSR
jgi:TonB family protein